MMRGLIRSIRTIGRWLLAIYDHAVIWGGVTLLGVICLFWAPLVLLAYPFIPARHARPIRPRRRLVHSELDFHQHPAP